MTIFSLLLGLSNLCITRDWVLTEEDGRTISTLLLMPLTEAQSPDLLNPLEQALYLLSSWPCTLSTQSGGDDDGEGGDGCDNGTGGGR